MAGRIGDVLYWLGSGIAVICLILAAIFAWNRTGADDRLFAFVLFVVPGLLAWLTGRAARYILAGR